MSLLWLGLTGFAVSGYADSLLAEGDAGMLAAPVADFRTELERIKLPPARFQAVPTNRCDAAQAGLTAETDDLRAALQRAGRPISEVERVVNGYRIERSKLIEFDAALEGWSSVPGGHFDEDGHYHPKPCAPRPEFPKINPVEGLPDEFADYLLGTAAWHNPDFVDKNNARLAWEQILELPPADRRFKSTWAAFMLGRSWEEKDPDKAIEYYQQVRSLAQARFSDRVGLAAASLGREARACLYQTNYERAIELYLRQMATGDDTAQESLCFTMRRLLSGSTAAFPRLAANPHSRRVVTAYLISTRALQLCSSSWLATGMPLGSRSNRLVHIVSDWLAAAEQAGVDDAETVEELALAAYQSGQWEVAQRWIDRAGASPTAQWLEAKLLLRRGKTDPAGARLAWAVRLLPLGPRDANAPIELKDNLRVPRSDIYYWHDTPAAAEVRAELGVFRLAQGDYSAALDSFMSAGAWMDAAYVAERVLTVDELQSYVDRNCPAPPDAPANPGGVDSATVGRLRLQIRYLLARRLTRAMRGDEAREYYPAEWRPAFDSLAGPLRAGWDEALAVDRRARALFEAAQSTYTNGMELIGTELGPDWHVYGGDARGALTTARRSGASCRLLPASPEELRRAAAHGADPEARFHYRYQAAALAWEAARLMPDNSQATARVLCIAGSWLKYLDPQTADLFYKALVRRSRKTALGAEADRIRWFPRLDANGDLIPGPRPPGTEPPPSGAVDSPGPEIKAVETVKDYPLPGAVYIVHLGDTFPDLVKALLVWGQPVSGDHILEANPGLDPAHLRVGQRIFIPEPTPQPAQP